MNLRFAALLLLLTIFRYILSSNSPSLITVKEFRELEDLISEEKQLRHSLEHDIDSLRRQIGSSEADFKNLQLKYDDLSTAYDALKISKDELMKKIAALENTNRTLYSTISMNHADILDLQQKTGFESAFTAMSPSSTSVTDPVIFSTVLNNLGNDYDHSTGKFTCRIPGLYVFTLNLYKYPSSSYNYARCYIKRNGSTTVRAYLDPYSSADGYYYEATNSVVLHLDHGDVVTVGSCSGYVYSYSSFSGFLVTAD